MSLSDPTATLMFAEAAEAADVVARQFSRNHATLETLAASLRAAPPPFVVTCARGSSDHAATYGKYLLETQLGLVVASASPSVGSVYAAPLQLRGALFIVISQSGKSPDLLRNAEKTHEGVAIGSYPFFREGRTGANFVVRSPDPAAVDACIADLTQGLEAAGHTVFPEGI